MNRPIDSMDVYADITGEGASLMHRRLEEAKSDIGLDANDIRPKQHDQPLPLIPAQHRLWAPGSMRSCSVHHLALALRLSGKLNRAALRATLDRLVARHEILRTRFRTENGGVVQIVGATDSGLPLHDRHVGESETVEEVTRQEVLGPFDLTGGSLIRARLMRLSEHEHTLLLTLHELVADKWSVGVLKQEFIALYDAFANQQLDPLPPSKLQFGDYVLWQGRSTNKRALPDQLEFWRQRLSWAPERIRLPTDRHRTSVEGHSTSFRYFEIGPGLSGGVRELAGRQGTTVFVAMMSAVAVVLSRWSGQDDVVVGVSFPNRPSQDLQALIGPLCSNAVLRVGLKDDDTVDELLQQVSRGVAEAYANRDIPFTEMLKILNRSFGAHIDQPLQVQVEAGINQAKRMGPVQVAGLTLTETSIASTVARHELLLSIDEDGREISIGVEYIDRVFEEETIGRLIEHWSTVLQGMVADHHCRIDTLSLMTTAERTRVLYTFNDTAVSYGPQKLLHELFEDQAARSPEVVALIFERQRLTYAELNARANQLAHYLRAHSIGPDKLVAVCLERSVEMVIGLLGVLKSGGAYIPLDPGYPVDRLAYMLKDSAPRLLLTQEHLKGSVPTTEALVIALDADRGILDRYDIENLDSNSIGLTARNLAYVIYTSGSTGTPKGAMNEHAGVVNRLRWMQAQYSLDVEDRVLQKTPFSFDVSVWEFFWTLMSGASLVVARPQGHQDPVYLKNVIEEAHVTTLHFVPSMLQVFLDSMQSGSCASVRHVVCSGEELSASLRQKVFDCLPHAHLSNLYGPTEVAIDVTAWECQPREQGSRVPIGRPISNIQMYILDRHSQPVPIGITGEIYIGGIGVGRGYLNRQDMTAQRFLDNPFGATQDARMYRTGDLGRWRADGALEYLGRNDYQVKLRGFRIELGEIEAQLVAQGGLREAVVVAREDDPGNRRLVAYVVPTENTKQSGMTDSFMDDELVDQWQSIYDDSYDLNGGSTGPNFAGWNSSYTGLRIPEEEMREWLDCTVDRIRRLEPTRVLEIGCGVGLLVERLAPGCAVYRGTDISAVAVKELRQWLAKQPSLQHVEVSRGVAADLTAFVPGSFDTVILNSVAQHFPNVEYLLSVVQQSLNLIGEKGQIFIGDVRNRELLELFHTSVQLEKAGEKVSLEDLRLRSRRAVDQEKQLVISPELFHLLTVHFPRISSVDIQLKRGFSRNELTVFRYDVILRVGQMRAAEPSPDDLSAGLRTVSQAEAELVRRRPAVLQLCGLANRRLERANAILLALGQAVHHEVGELRRELEEKRLTAEDPEAFWSLGERYGYEVAITWTRGTHGGEFDVRFCDPEQQVGRLDNEAARREPAIADIAWDKYVNDPIALRYRQQLASQLREALKSSLPDYMIPSAVVVLHRLPLTPNGKLDRSALPSPEFGVYASRRYEAPQGNVEELLANIWEDLLRIERVGRHDNFFELGGHSLLVVQMLERLRRAGLFADVRSVFERPTLVEFASTLLSQTDFESVVPLNLIPFGCAAVTPEMLPLVELNRTQIAQIEKTVVGGAENILDIYPLGPLQEGILFHHVLNEEGGDTYVLPTLLSFSSKMKLEQFVAALQWVLDRHDILRSSVLWEDVPRPIQVVYRKIALPVEEISLDSKRDPVEQLQAHMRPERQRMDLRHAPLMRLQVAPDSAGVRWYAILQLHHLVGDHESLEIVFSEVRAHLKGCSEALPPPVQYRNHVAQTLARARPGEISGFFRKKLGDVYEPTVPFGLADVRGDGSRIAEVRKALGPDLANRIRMEARRLSVSVATLFHAAWGLVVSRTSGRNDVVYGTVLLGRLQGSAGAQRILGLFINSLPIRLQLEDMTARELVAQTQRELVDLLKCEQASLAVAQRCSGIIGSAPLFSALLNYRHATPGEAEWTSAGSGIQVLASQGLTNYPMTLSVDDLGEGFVLVSQTDKRIDPLRVAEYMETALLSLVESLERAPQTSALSLSVLPDTERRQIIKAFNETRTEYPRQKLIHQLFEEQVQRTPDATAVQDAKLGISYVELNRMANRLARYLRKRGVGSDRVVAVCCGRNIEMVVSLLAVLKAGGAYLPLDPDYPTERLAFMLDDAVPQVVLTEEQLRSKLPQTKSEVIALDRKLNKFDGYSGEDLSAAELGLTSKDLVYVIYTSGSTGNPKGTAMSHYSVVNLIEWHRGIFPVNEGQRVLQFASLSFDVAFQEIFSTLCTGGTLVLLDEWVRTDPIAFTELVSSRRINRLFIPPLVLQTLAECFSASKLFPPDLRDVITAGEQLRISGEIASLFRQLNGCRLHNHYGPTETHVVTALTLSGSPEQWPMLPSIGRPISNSTVYVLDKQQMPVPIGVQGEIYIGGAGVAQGYLGRPELTVKRFIQDPFSAEAGARLYRTGDLGSFQPDGTVEYLGRNDDQVKIRGFRIELGEIEAQLLGHRNVKEAVVLPREYVAGEKRLVAYVTLNGDVRTTPTSNSEELRAHLQGVLPEYMIPSALVILEGFPRTANGKLDRRALPMPDFGVQVGTEGEAPQGEVEQMVAGIWRELLHLEHIGRGAGFFELGGHSLLAMQLIVRVRSLFSIKMPMRSLFEHPTLAAFSVRVSELRKDRLLHEITEGGEDIEKLLESVTSMSEDAANELVKGLERGGRS
jgi:amino acid adenylation domain-containing protein